MKLRLEVGFDLFAILWALTVFPAEAAEFPSNRLPSPHCLSRLLEAAHSFPEEAGGHGPKHSTGFLLAQHQEPG